MLTTKMFTMSPKAHALREALEFHAQEGAALEEVFCSAEAGLAVPRVDVVRSSRLRQPENQANNNKGEEDVTTETRRSCPMPPNLMQHAGRVCARARCEASDEEGLHSPLWLPFSFFHIRSLVSLPQLCQGRGGGVLAVLEFRGGGALAALDFIGAGDVGRGLLRGGVTEPAGFPLFDRNFFCGVEGTCVPILVDTSTLI
jgi:hypothetical protein